MAEVLLYHHVQGLTDGVRSFADGLRAGGHTVHTPDLFDGRTFETIEEGMAFAREAGFGALVERGGRADGDPRRRRLRRLLLRRHARPVARPDPTRRPRRTAHLRLPAGHRVRRRLARGRPGADPRDGGRPGFVRGLPAAGRSPTRRPTPSCSSIPATSTLRRLLAGGLRPRRRGAAHGARARVPERRGAPVNGAPH